MAENIVKVAFQLLADSTGARQAIQSFQSTVQSSFSTIQQTFQRSADEQEKAASSAARALAEQEKAVAASKQSASGLASVGQEAAKSQPQLERYGSLLKTFEASLQSVATGNTEAGATFRRFGIDVTQALQQPAQALQNFARQFAALRTSGTAPAREIVGAARSLFGGENLTKTIGDLDSLGRSTQAFTTEAAKGAAASTSAGEAIAAIGSAGGGAATGLSLATVALTAFIGLAVLAVAAVAKLGVETFNLSKQAAEAGTKFQDLNDKSGVSIRNLALFSQASAEAGKGFDVAERSLDQFVSRMDDAKRTSGETREAFNRVGIDPAKGFKDINAAFETAVKNLNQYKNTAERSADAQRIFGLRNEAIVPILSRVGGSLDDYAKRTGAIVTLNEQSALAAKSFSVSLNSLNTATGQAGQVIGVAFLPLFQPLIDLMTTLTRNTVRGLIVVLQELRPIIVGAGVAFDVLHASLRAAPAFYNVARAAVGDLLTTFARLIQAGGSVGRTLNALFTGDFAGATAFAAQAVDQVSKVFDSTGELTKKALAEAAAETSKQLVKIQEERKRLGREDRSREPVDVTKAKAQADAESKARLKILELAEREARRVYQDTTEELKRQYDKRAISSQEYTDRAIAALRQLREAEQATLAEERRVVEASKLKSTEKETKLAEIAQKEREVQSRFNRDQARLQDEEAKRQIETARARERAIAEIRQTADQQAIARIRDLADARIITAAEAERRVGEIEQQGFDRRRAALNDEFLAAGANLQEQARVNNELIKLEAERAAATEDTSRRVQAALQEEANDRARLRREIEELTRESAELQNQTALERNQRQQQVNQDPAKARQLLQERFDLLVQEEQLRTQQNRARLLESEDALLDDAQTQEQRLEIQEAFNVRFEAEARRHNEALAAIRQEAALSTAATDPSSNQSLFGINDEQTSRLTAFSQAASLALSQVSASAGNMQGILNSAFASVSSGLTTMLQNMILTGQTGPAAFKKLAAGAIAGIAAQSLVKAIFETAEGFAALARFDGAAAALHFKAAATYAAVGAIAGGIAAGIGGGGGGAGAGGGGGSAGDGRSQASSQFEAPQRDLRASEGSPFETDFDRLKRDLGIRVSEGEAGPFGLYQKLLTTLDKLDNKFEAVSPGQVLMAGAAERPDVIATTVVEEQVRDAGFIREAGLNFGLR